MSFGNIVGSLLQQGMSGATQPRLQNTMGNRGLGSQGGGLDGLVNQFMGASGSQSGGSQSGGSGSLLSALSGGGSSGGGGGIMGAIGGLLNQGQQAANRNPNMAAGGLGALAGALLGGASGGSSMRGALGGGAMALLGTMAVSALRNRQSGAPQDHAAAAPGLAESSAPPPADLPVPQDKAEEMTSAKAEELVLRGMIQAAKADGRIGPDEMERIAGKIGEDGVSPEEKQFVMDEMNKPFDVQSLINDIPSQEVGAQVYAAALLAIEVDTPSEQEFLQKLAGGIGLDAAAVQQLHAMTNTPAPA